VKLSLKLIFIFSVLLQKRDEKQIYENITEQVSPFMPHLGLNNNNSPNKNIYSVQSLNPSDEEGIAITPTPSSLIPKKPLLELITTKLTSVEEMMGPIDDNELKHIDEKFAEEDDDNKNILVIQIENWLCSGFFKNNLDFKKILVDDDPPLIGKNEYISHFFKIHDNFKVLLSLILDPMCNAPSNCVKTFNIYL